MEFFSEHLPLVEIFCTCSFNLAVLHFSLSYHSFLYPFVHPGLSCVWCVISLRGSWYLLLLAPLFASTPLIYSRPPLVVQFVLLLVSVSTGLVGVGLVSLCWVLQSRPVILPSIVISSSCIFLCVLLTVCYFGGMLSLIP